MAQTRSLSVKARSLSVKREGRESTHAFLALTAVAACLRSARRLATICSYSAFWAF